MRILFDQGVPVPLRGSLIGHEVSTAHEMGWARLSNGELLAKAERAFDVLVTTDQGLRYQQTIRQRTIAILVLPTTSWPRIQGNLAIVIHAVASLEVGSFVEMSF